MKETIEIIKYLFSNEGDVEAKIMFKVGFVCMTISLICLGCVAYYYFKYL